MKILFFLFFTFLSAYSNSGLYQCKNELGETEFKDVPCAEGQTQKTLIKSVDNRGFLKKYFQVPRFNSMKSKCIGRTCYCGSEGYNTKGSSVRQLQDSASELVYLHRSYKRKLKSYNYKKSKGYSKESNDLKEQSCLIRLHQKLFNKNYSLYENLIEKTKISKSKIAGEAVVCGDKPKREHSIDEYEYNRILGVWNNCKDKKQSNWTYKSTTRNYKENKSTLDRTERALLQLKTEH